MEEDYKNAQGGLTDWGPTPIPVANTGAAYVVLPAGDVVQYNRDIVTHSPNDESAKRKATPICTGVLDYFPDALAAVARVSKAGNDKHNPGQPLHWSRGKSNDHADCVVRHLATRDQIDVTDGETHLAHAAWRVLALLQLQQEKLKS